MKKQKLLQRFVSITVLALFILSLVPFVFADTDNTDKDEDNTDKDESTLGTGGEIDIINTDISSSGKGKIKSSVKANINADVKTDLKNAKIEFKKSKEELKEAKEKAKEGRVERKHLGALIEKKQEQYQKQHQEYIETKEKYHQHREKLHQLKSEAKCKNDSEECKARKSELKQGVKQHLLKTIELIDSSLNRLTERVENSNVLTDDEKKTALEQILALETEVTEDKKSVEALSETAANEEVRQAVKDLKETWKNVRKVQHRIIASLISSKLGHLVDKHTEYQNGMEARIAELRTAGVDVTELEHLLDNFKVKVAQLKEDEKVVHAKWLEIRDGKGSMDAWHTAQQEVRKDMKESKDILRMFISLYKELKETGANTSAAADIETSTNIDTSSNNVENVSETSAEETTQVQTTQLE